MKKTIRLAALLQLLLLLLPLALTACTGETEQSTSGTQAGTVLTAQDGNVTFTLALDKPSYTVGQTIEAKVSATNNSLFSKKIYANTTSLGESGCLSLSLLTNGNSSYAVDSRVAKVQNGNRYETSLGRGKTLTADISYDTAYAIDMTGDFSVTLAVVLQMQNGKDHQVSFEIPITDPGYQASLADELENSPIIDTCLVHALLYTDDTTILKNLCVRFDTAEEAEAFKERWFQNDAVTILSTGKYVHTVTFEITRAYLLTILREGCEKTISRA